MPHIIDPLRIQPLNAELRKDTKLGAEVFLPSTQALLNLEALSGNDKETLRKALFAHGVLVIRNQAGLDPTVLVALAKLFDPAPLDHHSGGAKQVTDPNNILSLNNCSRIPKAPQVTVIGKGRVEGVPRGACLHHTPTHSQGVVMNAISMCLYPSGCGVATRPMWDT